MPLVLRPGALPWLVCGLLSAACGESADPAVPERGLDLAELGDSGLRRVYGSTGDGSLGLAVAGGGDVDGDGLPDAAFGAMQAAPGGVPGAGRVYLILGDGSLDGALDTALPNPAIVQLDGAQPFEHAGSEIWIDDVTGDGIADLLIARQNHSPVLAGGAERLAAGALSVVSGGPALRELGARLEPLRLDEPEPELAVLTLAGAAAAARLGIWVRSGDVTGDGTADIVVGADREAGEAGAAYVVVGGPHLSATARVDLAALGGSPLAGYVARLSPPANPSPLGYHFGATCQLADLDGNGRAEVLVAAALDRAGAVLDVTGGTGAPGSGGAPRGSLFIAWDDNFPAPPWPVGLGFDVDAGGGSVSVLGGGRGSDAFGEELLGGLDWDADGTADLFVGDLTADVAGRPDAGRGHVIYDAARLRGLNRSIDELSTIEPAIRTTTILGAQPGDIAADTAGQGDFSGDALADLVVCSPHHSPLRRHSAGALHVFYGRPGGWPDVIDLRAAPSEVERLAVFGARGSFGVDRGDTLCYSAATGDLDGDGRTDLITNEMVGNGRAPEALNVGNLLLLGSLLAAPLP